MVGGGGSWEVWSRVDLKPRSDTNRINSSPVTRTSPIIEVQNGKHHEIILPGINIFFLISKFNKVQPTLVENFALNKRNSYAKNRNNTPLI